MEEIYHKYEKYNGTDTLVIYVNYPADYEFGLDFETTKKRIKSLAQKIREYAFSNLDKFNNQTVLLILNGVVVGSILLTTLTGKLQAKEIKNISKASIISQSEDTIVDSKSSNSLQVQTYDKAIEEKTSSTQVNTTYINNINHNRYLKINYKNQYNYSQLYQIIINIRFKKNLNNKFAILCIFFLFHDILLKNHFLIIYLLHLLLFPSRRYEKV